VSRQAKGLFGRPTRVLLAAWILGRSGEPFYLLEAQVALSQYGESGSAVASELVLFAQHGLVARTSVGRRVYFTPLVSPFWAAFDAISTALGLTPADVAAELRRQD